jgi:nascent polypeptide-associated complex subunit alpha
MMPGMRGMSPKQMEQMMKRMGMREIEAEKVIIRTKEGKIVIRDPSVSVIEVQGKRTYTIVGDDRMVKGKPRAEGAREKGETDEEGGEEETKEGAKEEMGGEGKEGKEGTEEEAAPGETKPKFTDEDVKIVAAQAGVSEEKARKALEECDGAPAEAIVRLMGG